MTAFFSIIVCQVHDLGRATVAGMGTKRFEGENDMKSFISLSLIITLIAFISGCLLLGKNKEYQPFDTSGLDRLTPGRTMASEVTEMFGAPTEVVKLSNGNAYIYKRSLSKGTGLWLVIVSFGNYDTDCDQLVFFFDQNDVLRHYGVSLNAGKASYGLPF